MPQADDDDDVTEGDGNYEKFLFINIYKEIMDSNMYHIHDVVMLTERVCVNKNYPKNLNSFKGIFLHLLLRCY